VDSVAFVAVALSGMGLRCYLAWREAHLGERQRGPGRGDGCELIEGGLVVFGCLGVPVRLSAPGWSRRCSGRHEGSGSS
jgi:hypothetical protein